MSKYQVYKFSYELGGGMLYFNDYNEAVKASEAYNALIQVNA